MENFLNDQVQIIISNILIYTGIVLFLVTIFSIYTLISFLLIYLGFRMIILQKLKHIEDKGLLEYFSESTKKTLLERSIFDILCDVWFIPNVSLWVKMFVRPFMNEMRPEEAIQNLDDLPVDAKRAILTKVRRLKIFTI